jgi:hypothetical protein
VNTPATYVILKTDGGFLWQLFSPDKRLVAVSPVAYPTMDECEQAIERVRALLGSNIKIVADPTA